MIWKNNYRMRISKHVVFKDGHMREMDIPRIIKEDIRSPFECGNIIRNMFGDCIPDGNLYDYFPRKIGEMPFMMLCGKNCRCRLFIEIYEVKEKE